MLNIKIGTKLMVTALNDGGNDDQDHNILISAFEENFNDGTFLIHAPLFRDLLIPISIDTECLLSFHDETASYSFEGKVIERVTRGSVKFLKLEQTAEIERTQRREDFRLKILLDCKVDQAYVDENNQRKVRRLPACTADISGGGASVRLNFKPEPKEVIICHLPIGENNTMMSFPAEVCWAYKIDNPDAAWKYSCGIKFIFKNKPDKEALIKIIFALQLQQRRKERSS